MRWHIVGALQCVGVQRIVFGNQAIEPVFQVVASAVVVALLDQQAG
jgi:hypothetical protein